MRKIKFYKYHGTGNDFVIIDNRDQKIIFTSPEDVASLCDRRFGIGADGLILLENSGQYDFRMIYYNADGHEGSMCGNGGRCIVAFANFLGMIEHETIFEAIDGIHEASILNQNEKETEVSLKMGDVNSIEINNDNFILNTGSPHYVIFTNSIDDLNVIEEGRKIRYNERFSEKGINVNFVSQSKGQNEIRTYERGVEDETWSCGTGSVAAAIALEINGSTIPGKPVEILTRGGKLKIGFTRDGNSFSNVSLTGPTILVYEGQIENNNK